MAGRFRENAFATSLSPVAEDSEEDVGDVAEEMANEDYERIGLPKEDEVVKRIVDPKLPSQEEVDRHYLMGHLPYRNWCPVCVRAKGRDQDHTADSGKERRLPA